MGVEVTENKTFTATFTQGTYTVSFAELTGITPKTADGSSSAELTATYGTDYKFKLDVNTSLVTLNSVSYSIGGVDKGTLAEVDGVYTIAGAEITGTSAISYDATGLYTVTFVAEENGSITSGASQYVETDGYLTEDQVEAVEVEVADYYEFIGWYDGETLVEDLTEVQITSNKIFTAKFASIKRTITAPEGVTVTYQSGYSDADAVYGTPVVFTVSADGGVVFGISYNNGVDAVTALTPVDGVYTLPGDAIKGNITLTASKASGTLTFITATNYGVINNVIVGKSILLFKTDKLEEGKAYKFDGATMFYSEKYEGYVWVVDDTYSDLTAAPEITVADGNAFVIAYDGDINETGTVTAADAGIINDCLHGHRQSDLSLEMLFELDVNGDGIVSTTDITSVLTTAVK